MQSFALPVAVKTMVVESECLVSLLGSAVAGTANAGRSLLSHDRSGLPPRTRRASDNHLLDPVRIHLSAICLIIA